MAESADKSPQEKQAQLILAGLKRHPRLDFQELVSEPAKLNQLQLTLPYLVPFKGTAYAGFLPLLDWDHHLPSRNIVLRLYAYYTPKTLSMGRAAFQTRCAQITERDKFPEFDVPDFADLVSDEAYEGTVEPSGKVTQVSLASEWRRTIEPDRAAAARKLVRKSEEFRRISQKKDRPDYLGDLEARSWTPPCEGGAPRWTVDVWYLTEYNGMMGKGLSFLVDLDRSTIINIREFVIRTA